ncbi:MAG TPA: hypothetical protein VGI69_04525 [Gaiellaceae bacterium]
MDADEGFVSATVAADRPTRRVRLRANLATGAFWLLGSAVVVLAQPNTDRKLAAAGAAVAGIATIVVIGALTPDRDRRYVRSLIGAMVAVSVTGDGLLQLLTGSANGFQLYGLDTRIALPLIVVLLAPLVLRALPRRLRSRALWADRAAVVREARPLDWLVAAYAFLILPDLALGLAHHAPKSYIAQDLGLIVFFVFAYVAGRTVSTEAGRASAAELVAVLLVLAAGQALFGWGTTPIFTYVEAACAAAAAFALFRPNKAGWLLLALALALLVNDAIDIKNGSGSTTGIEFVAALGLVAYLVVRVWHLLPQWLVVAVGVAALAGFLVFTADGQTVRGQYRGPDQSNLGRTYEAHQVREEIHSSPVSFVFGRGIGGTVDETQAPRLFAESLVYGGRDLAHVPQVHLLSYEFLLKYGLLGFAWLGALLVGVAILGIRALEAAARDRDPTPVIYAALPLLGIAAALAAATHFQDNPLNAFAVGVLVTRFGGEASSRLRLGVALPAVAVVCAAVGAVAFGGSVAPFYPSGPGVSEVEVGLPLTNKAVVGRVGFAYPAHYHLRRFATSNHAVTGVHGARARGVVVASYPLKRRPEVGASGRVLRPDGVFFELYKAPRHAHPQGAKKKLPLILFDFPQIRAFRNTPGIEQGGAFFRVHGRNYQAMLWVGKDASKISLLTIDFIVESITAR